MSQSKANNGKTKILLISANRFSDPYPVYPLALSYLHAAIEHQLPHFDVKICDMHRMNVAGLEGVLEDFDPQYVGISLRNIDDVNSFIRNNFIAGYQEIIELVRAKTTAIVIIGGAGFSIYPELLFRTLSPDFGICSEGENSLCELLDCLEKKQSPSAIEGLVWNDNHTIVVNPRETFIHSLDVSFSDDLLDFYWRESGMLNIQTKRGCPYNCIYCTYPLIEGRCVRTLDVDRIVDTLSDLYHRKQVDYVFFTDSVFNIATEFNARLCEAIIRSGIKIRWGAYFTPHNLSHEMLGLYQRAGLTHVEFGSESFSDIQLENYGKHFRFADIHKASEACMQAGVYYAHFLILGGYGETDQTIAETFLNSQWLRSTVFFPYVGMRIYPGTRLQEIAIAEGKISNGDTLLEPTYYISENFDPSTLKQQAAATGKAWIFPDEPESEIMHILRTRKCKKGPIWEYLRKS